MSIWPNVIICHLSYNTPYNALYGNWKHSALSRLDCVNVIYIISKNIFPAKARVSGWHMSRFIYIYISRYMEQQTLIKFSRIMLLWFWYICAGSWKGMQNYSNSQIVVVLPDISAFHLIFLLQWVSIHNWYLRCHLKIIWVKHLISHPLTYQ